MRKHYMLALLALLLATMNITVGRAIPAGDDDGPLQPPGRSGSRRNIDATRSNAIPGPSGERAPGPSSSRSRTTRETTPEPSDRNSRRRSRTPRDDSPSDNRRPRQKSHSRSRSPSNRESSPDTDRRGFKHGRRQTYINEYFNALLAELDACASSPQASDSSGEEGEVSDLSVQERASRARHRAVERRRRLEEAKAWYEIIVTETNDIEAETRRLRIRRWETRRRLLGFETSLLRLLKRVFRKPMVSEGLQDDRRRERLRNDIDSHYRRAREMEREVIAQLAEEEKRARKKLDEEGAAEGVADDRARGEEVQTGSRRRSGGA